MEEQRVLGFVAWWKDAVKETAACWAVESLIVVLQYLGDQG